MVRQFLPVSALLLGSGLLLFAGGINALILPVRGAAEGFSAASLGLLGTGWAVGYVLGCWRGPRLVGKVGHIRAFSVMSAFAAVALLASLLFLTPWVWVPLRAISGFCFAGAAMIVESWLNERANPNTRGRIFGVYTMVNLTASTGGQMALTLGDTSTFLFFVLGAIFYCLALVPTAISSSASPRPLVSVKLDLKALWRNSPVAVVGVLCIGVSNSAFGTLAAVYADDIGLGLGAVAMFASLPILAGAVSQMPIGFLSDRMDRRKVLVGVALLAAAIDAGFILVGSHDQWINIGLACALGAMIYAMYPVIIAHASDHAAEGQFIQVSGGLLMLYGIGAIAGPSLAGFAMQAMGQTGLFAVTAGAHVALVLFALLRMSLRKAVARKDGFKPIPPARVSTPSTVALAAGAEEAEAAIVAAGAELVVNAKERRTAAETPPENLQDQGDSNLR